MTGENIVTQIVGILVSGIQALGSGIGQGVNNFVTSLAFTGTGSDQTLSIYFIVVLAFAGVALCIGLTRHIFSWLASLGGSN